MATSIPFGKINDILARWAANTPPIEDFTVENVLYAAGLDSSYYEIVLRFLMSKAGFELIPKKMLVCPSNHKIQAFDLDEELEGELFDCFCGESDFEAEDFILVFSFTDDFKKDALALKKKFMKNQEQRHLQLV
jgi:hypothetical protein